MGYQTTVPSPVSWMGMPYPEILDVADSDGSVLIVPVGSLEQHGYHMPTGTDTILVDAVATAGAERVADEVPILVTPPVWSGYSPHHMTFGGTVTVEHEHLLWLLEDIADAALENGFDALVLLNGHGGNRSLVSSATSTIGKEHPDAEIFGLTYFQLGARFMDEIRESDLGGIVHAGEFETSLMMHLHPDLVREDAIESTMRDADYELQGNDLLDAGMLSNYGDIEDESESGALGAAEYASAEKGAEIFARLGDEMEAFLTEVHENTR
jgi:creatinine amidohydrolase